MGITRFRRPGTTRTATGERASASAPLREETVDHGIAGGFRLPRLFGVHRPGRQYGALPRQCRRNHCIRTAVAVLRCDGIQDHSSLLEIVGRPCGVRVEYMVAQGSSGCRLIFPGLLRTRPSRAVSVDSSERDGKRPAYPNPLAPRTSVRRGRVAFRSEPDGWSVSRGRRGGGVESGSGGHDLPRAHPAAEAALPVGNISIDFSPGIRGSEASR